MTATATFVALLFAGIVMLGRARGPRWLRFLGRGLTAALALGFSWLAIGLIRFGADRGWTGDGPGMLVVMLAIPVAALCALAMWVGLFLPSTATSRVPAWLAIGAIASAWPARAGPRSTRAATRSRRTAHRSWRSPSSRAGAGSSPTTRRAR